MSGLLKNASIYHHLPTPLAAPINQDKTRKSEPGEPAAGEKMSCQTIKIQRQNNPSNPSNTTTSPEPQPHKITR
jgi:hypothetical protein